jgi:hypothetical protein
MKQAPLLSSMMYALMFGTAVLIAVPGHLAGATLSGSYPFRFGNEQASASGSFHGAATNGPGYADLLLRAQAGVRFLGVYVPGVGVMSRVVNSGGRRSATFQVVINGYIVDSETRSVSWTWSKSLPRTLVTSPPLMIWVGPVPVTLRGSIGGGASGSLSLTLSASAAGASGSLSVWANGSASAGVGVPGYNASLRATLELLKSTVSAGFSATFTSLGGHVTLTFQPMRVVLEVVVRAWPLQWTKNLVDQSYGYFTRRLIGA